jgi:hypothetical protein
MLLSSEGKHCSTDMRKCNQGKELRLPFNPIIPATCANTSAALTSVRELNSASDKCARSPFGSGGQNTVLLLANSPDPARPQILALSLLKVPVVS